MGVPLQRFKGFLEEVTFNPTCGRKDDDDNNITNNKLLIHSVCIDWIPALSRSMFSLCAPQGLYPNSLGPHHTALQFIA